MLRFVNLCEVRFWLFFYRECASAQLFHKDGLPRSAKVRHVKQNAKTKLRMRELCSNVVCFVNVSLLGPSLLFSVLHTKYKNIYTIEDT